MKNLGREGMAVLVRFSEKTQMIEIIPPGIGNDVHDKIFANLRAKKFTPNDYEERGLTIFIAASKFQSVEEFQAVVFHEFTELEYSRIDSKDRAGIKMEFMYQPCLPMSIQEEKQKAKSRSSLRFHVSTDDAEADFVSSRILLESFYNSAPEAKPQIPTAIVPRGARCCIL